MSPGLEINTSAGFVTFTIVTQDNTLLVPPLMGKMKLICPLEFEMSHYYQSTLNIKVCCYFIEPDSARKMKKQIIYITGV